MNCCQMEEENYALLSPILQSEFQIYFGGWIKFLFYFLYFLHFLISIALLFVCCDCSFPTYFPITIFTVTGFCFFLNLTGFTESNCLCFPTGKQPYNLTSPSHFESVIMLVSFSLRASNAANGISSMSFIPSESTEMQNSHFLKVWLVTKMSPKTHFTDFALCWKSFFLTS